MLNTIHSYLPPPRAPIPPTYRLLVSSSSSSFSSSFFPRLLNKPCTFAMTLNSYVQVTSSTLSLSLSLTTIAQKNSRNNTDNKQQHERKRSNVSTSQTRYEIETIDRQAKNSILVSPFYDDSSRPYRTNETLLRLIQAVYRPTTTTTITHNTSSSSNNNSIHICHSFDL